MYWYLLREKSIEMSYDPRNYSEYSIAPFIIFYTFVTANAKIAQLVEHDLAKVGVAGSSPVFRSINLLKTISCF